MFPSDQFNGKKPHIEGRGLCPECGLPNKCGIEAGKSKCWCFSHPVTAVISDTPKDRCLCQSCLRSQQ